MSHLRVAVIGAGHLGRIHAQLLKQNPLAELVGVVDPVVTSRELLSQSLRVPHYSNWHQVPDKLDAAIVATPTHTHASIGLELIEQGIHLLMEKPLADTLASADALLGTAQRQRVVLQVGHVERFNPAFLWLNRHTPQPHYLTARRTGSYTFRSTDVGVVLDLMIHDIELILNLAGDQPLEIQAWGTSLISQHEDVCQARLEFSSGLIADLFACRVDTQGERQMRLFGSDWQARVDFGLRSVELLRAKNKSAQLATSTMPLANQPAETRQSQLDALLEHQHHAYPESNPLADQQTNFLRSVLGAESPRVTGQQGRRALAVARQILELVQASGAQSALAFSRRPARPRLAG